MMFRLLVRASKRLRRTAHFRAGMEALEGRQLLTVTADLRIVTYNIYSDIYTQGLIAPPEPSFETVLEGIGAESVNGIARSFDILALQETSSNAQTAAPIVAALNAHYGAGTYAYSTYQALSTGASDGNGPNALIYNTTTVSLISAVGIGFPDPNGPPRQPVRYEFRPVGGSSVDDFYVYNSHFKSGDEFTSNNGARRQAEAEEIRADAATLPTNSHILYVGDFNCFYSTDAGYATLTASGANQGIDPINQPVFHGGPRATLTDRSDSLSSRLDFQLSTQDVLSDPTDGLYLRSGSYHVFGNDGSAKNVSQSSTALAGLPNRTAVLQALVNSSDHLPVVADYTVPVTPPVGPTVGSLSASPTSVAAGTNVTLTANNVVQFGTGAIASVGFYRETNGIAGLQPGSDALVGFGAQSGSTWSLLAPTTGLGGGVYTFYAQAKDNTNRLSDAVSTTVTVSGPATPTIGSFTVDPTTATEGDVVTLDASNVTKLGGTITNVEFYRESNGTPGLQVGSDLKLGNGTKGGTDWLYSTNTIGLASGQQTYYAVATDNIGTRSAASGVVLTITAPQPPTIGSLTANPSSASAGTPVSLTASGVAATGGASVAGVAFYLETNGVPGLQTQSDTFVADGIPSGSNWSASIDTTGVAAGTQTYYAQAVDSRDQVSTAASTNVTLTAPSLPFVNVQILASASPAGPFTSSLVVTPSQTLYFEVIAQLAGVGTTNGTRTINSLTSVDGINSLSFQLLNLGASDVPVSFTAASLATPSTDPAAAFSWSAGIGAKSGTIQGSGGGTNNQLANVRPIHSPGVYSGALASDAVLFGTFVVSAGALPGGTSQITGAFAGINSAIRINNGQTLVAINTTTESSASPLVGFTALTLTRAALPSWLSPESDATWDGTSHTLTVNGPATIIADPGSDSPKIVANSASAQLEIAPTTIGFVHLGGVTLTNGAGITVPPVGVGRTHTNHNVIVIDADGVTPGTFSIDTSSKFDLADNDMVVRKGNAAVIGALATQGRNLTPGIGGDWTGNGLTSSAAAAAYVANFAEVNLLAVATNGSLYSGGFSEWQAGSDLLTLAVDDVLVKYTYNGDFDLDGKVDDNDFAPLGGNYDGGVYDMYAYIDGDTNGDGKVDDNDIGVFGGAYGLGWLFGDQL